MIFIAITKIIFSSFADWCEQHIHPWCDECNVPELWCNHGPLPSAQCPDCPGLGRISENEKRNDDISESLFSSTNSESLLAGEAVTQSSNGQDAQARIPAQISTINNSRTSPRPAKHVPDTLSECIQQDDTPDICEFLDRIEKQGSDIHET